MPSEFELIARYFSGPTPQTVLGPGDDCALFAPSAGMELAVTTDMLVSGTHFFPDTDPERLGWKTLAVNLSDLAAMGAKPRWVLLAGSLPQADERWLSRFSSGLFACAKRYGVDLIGGDTTRGPLNLCVTAFGELLPGTALRRGAARDGDDLWVSGHPGLAALGLAHLQGKIALPDPIRAQCLERLEKPLPRVELGLALRQKALANAAVDISDGLLADAEHVARASRLDLTVEMPLLPPGPDGVGKEVYLEACLSGGDDYELAFSAAPFRRDEIAALGGALDIPLWRIGSLTCGEGKSTLLDEAGRPVFCARRGFDHFESMG